VLVIESGALIKDVEASVVRDFPVLQLAASAGGRQKPLFLLTKK
jgi:hypothetical protein